VVLDYSERPNADSDGGAAQPEVAAMADLSLKSRIDDDADDAEDDSDDESETRNLACALWDNIGDMKMRCSFRQGD
jgi:hypothetical protein